MSGIPHDLEAAHQRFKRWAGRALETVEGEHCIPDWEEGRAAIRLFLHVFCEIPGAKAELERRARFVGEETAEGGRWAQAKKQAQPALGRLRKRFSEGSVRYRTGALQGLAKEAPSFDDLKYIDTHCSGLLQERIPQTERQPIENWHGETKRVVVSAERIGAEGARILGNWEELESRFNFGPQAPNRLAEVRLAQVIEHVGPAVDSLVAWQRDQKPEAECLVTLLQITAICNRSKRTGERWKADPSFPLPRVEGGGGNPAEWAWSEVRPWLEKECRRKLPERFPADRFVGR